MVGRAFVLVVAVASGCGRFGFDALSTSTSTTDGRVVDGFTIDSAFVSDAVPGVSCQTAALMCGPGNESCCTSPLVTGGTFFRGYDVAGDAMFTDTSNPATVSNFRLDKYEVTVERFRAFVDSGQGTQASPPPAGAGAHPLIANSGWNPAWNNQLALDTAALRAKLRCNAVLSTWTSTPGANEKLPVSCVTWFDAFAFCAWDGGRLATEAEWNYAASGGAAQRAYPWSIPSSSTTIDSSYSGYQQGLASFSNIVPVGSLTAGYGSYGQADLAGNVAEWALDYTLSTYPNPCTDCANISAGANRSLRGGSFESDSSGVRSALRGVDGPSQTREANGIRCARSM
ncbi:MAG TPA: SUMF1/EgtB/PvdO family nonheme iron enzyme [Kofleriaceae bacterium]|nr:SUMF1/EgtB/PvdO family nonheme iron enzyme [Kofleriaceae bacterium]